MAKYFTLLQRHENGRWGVAFGDYDREVVKEERQDYRDHGIRAKDLAIVTSEDSPEAVGKAIEAHQEACHQEFVRKHQERWSRTEPTDRDQ